MKVKFFTFLLSVLLWGTVETYAQAKRIWDFSKGLSAGTVSNLNADNENWIPETTDSNGMNTRWKYYGAITASEPLKANGKVIPETDYLLFDNDGYDFTSILISQEKLRVSRRFTKITFPRLKNGQTITIVGSSPNATASGRSIAPIQNYLKYVGDKNALTNGECLFLGKDIPGSQRIYTFKWKVETNEPDSVDVQFQIGSDGGIDFMLFAIDITSDESVNISAQGEVLKYQALLKEQMNDYIDKISSLSNSVKTKYTLKLQEVFDSYNGKLQSLIKQYYPTSELSYHLSEAKTYYTDCYNALSSTYNEAKDSDKSGGVMLPCRYDYVLICDTWTANGTSRPGMNVLFGDDYFLDVRGGTVSASKRSVDLSIVDGELVTEEIAAKYGGYGNHLNSLRLKNAQDVISMNVVKGSKLILFYNNNGAERYPLFCRDLNMSTPISAKSSMSATVEDKLQRMEWFAPEDMVVYIGSYGGDIYLSYIIVEATSLRTVSINLPQEANTSDYANMWLDLTNMESGQTLHYVMSNQNTYSFRNIPDNTTWNLTLRNQRGDVFGHLDNINVNGKDLNLTLDSLIKPQTVNLSVVTPEGKDVTEQTQVIWTDESGNESGQAPTLVGMMPGTRIGCRVTLPKELAMLYSATDTIWHTVIESGNDIRHKLEPITQITLTGKVVDSATKLIVNDASVSVSQTFGGKYNKTLTAKTDVKGNFTLTVGNVPTSLTVAAPDYVSQNIVCDSLMTGAETVTIPEVSLKPVTGAVISVAFTFTSSIAEGESEDVCDWYDDYKNITYSIFNKTQQRPISEFNVQHPQIVLLEEIAEGDILELTATSKTSAFMPVTVAATIGSDQRADVTLNIIELGKIRASFEKNGNATVVGSLYDADGKLLKSYDYNNASLITDNLPDGRYTLISMGSSKLFNTIFDLSRLPETGLVQGSDYIRNSVDVKSGVVSLIDINEIPSIDETKLYYTQNNNTYFTVNKLSIVSGNYLTLSAGLDFKPEYGGDIDKVCLVVDLPESCSFVDNSVMLGTNTGSYSVTGSQLIIPLKNITDRVRFCITPTLGGDYVSSAFVRFILNGATITQPIGSVNYSVKDLTIVVPSTATMTTIPVSGTSVGASTIEIYDENELIGQTTALENGVWATTCDLNEPYNLSTHSIYAKIRTNNGLELISETKNCVYDMNGIQVSKVTMYHWNSDMTTTYESVFDFLNPKTKPNQWTLNHHDKKFTYTVEFTENDPERISNVILYVHTADGSIVPSPAIYDEEKGLWCTNVDLGNTSNGYYPVNCSVDFDVEKSIQYDRRKLDTDISNIALIISTSNDDKIDFMNELHAEPTVDQNIQDLSNLLDQESFNNEVLFQIIENIVGDIDITGALNANELETFMLDYEKLFNIWYSNDLMDMYNDILSDFFNTEEVISLDSFNVMKTVENDVINFIKKPLLSFDETKYKEAGYECVYLTDGSIIWCMNSDMEFIIVDSKSMNEYICKRESINNLQIKASSRGAAGYVECGRRMIDICKTLISWSNDKDSSHQLRNLLLTLNEFMRSLTCYYDGFRADLEYQLSEKIKDRNLRFAKEESKAIDAIQQSKKTLATITNEIQALSKEQSRFISLIEQVQMQPGLTPDEIVEFTKEYNKELERISKMRDLKLTELNKTHKILEGATKNLERIKIASKTFAKASTKATEWLNKVPLKLVKGIKIPKALRIGGKLAGEFGIILQMISLYIDAEDVMEDMNRWQRIIDVIEAKIPCDANPYKAENLRDRILNAAWTHWGKHISILCAESTAIGCSAAGGVFLSPTWWAEMVISAAVEVSKFNHDRGSLDEITHFWSEVGQLICNKNCGLPGMPPCPDGGGNGGNGNNKPNGGEHPSGAPHDNVKTDPSGYVYEGVPTNRLEGVTTTVYYKEMVEDMYGDLHENIVKWNAEEYGQENPLITDKNGFYRWDVPQGLWQVKYEKEGYETTYSEWLPVPPPQLEVNIAMKQAVQPTIVDVRAYEDAIEFEFDKYMMPALLDTKNITVTVNGNRVEGMIQLLNEEASNESKTETFASKIRFNAEEPFNADKVTLNVSNKVESYAGVCMQDNFSKTLDIELEVRRIVCDSVATVGHGENGVMTVSVLPAVASAGKYLSVKTSSPTILATYAENVKIDENGEAEIIVTGELPGSAALMFSIDGYDLSASTIVNVKQIETVATPTANIASGTSVDKGTAITLSCATSGATIYYTLDGSCPCNDTSSRMVYDGTPIILDENVTIQAIATAPDMHESEIAEFTYIVKDLSAIDEISIEEDLRIFPLPVRDKLNVKADGNIIRSVVLINIAGATVAKTSASSDYVSLDVSGLRPGIYVIIIETENKTYSRKILKVK